MISISVKHELSQGLAKLTALLPEQYAFTVAKALTATAKDIQAELRRNMPQRFTLRRDWIVKGIVIQPATKTNLQAMVYSRDAKFMKRQETGGDKIPMQGGKYVAIPMPDVRRSKSQLIQKQDLPQNLKNSFIITTQDGRKFIAVRRGKKRKSITNRRSRNYETGELAFRRGGRQQVELLYELVKSARVQPRLGLGKDGNRIARERFVENLKKAAEYAIRTAR